MAADRQAHGSLWLAKVEPSRWLIFGEIARISRGGPAWVLKLVKSASSRSLLGQGE
jgi:hypothetical protein